MKRIAARLLFALLLAGAQGAQCEGLPEVGVGRIERIEAMPSRFVEPRNIDVWLPPGFPSAGRYDVLYMQDGQMLYDARTSGWNGQSWRIQDAIAPLIASQRMAPTIVVGIWNTGAHRRSEYYAEDSLAYAPQTERERFIARVLSGLPRANGYLRFLVSELKPEIDRRYPTRTDAAHTMLMGSSMGGVISLYAMSQYPGVFGAAACLSTHWYGSFVEDRSLGLAALSFFAQRIPDPASHRLYMDHGSRGLDAAYGPFQEAFDGLARAAGYTSANFRTLVFPGADHNEDAWAARAAQALEFLGAAGG